MRADLWSTSLCLACLAAGPATMAAQQKADFTPFVGVYLPMLDVLERRDVMAPGDRLTWKHQPSVMLGGRLGASVTERIAVEVAFGFALSKAEVVYTDPSNAQTTSDTSGTIFLGNARALIGVLPSRGNVSLHVTVGATVISRAGDAYSSLDFTEGTTDIGAIVGVGGKFRVGSSLAIRLDVEDNLYATKFRGSTGAATTGKLQSDAVVSLGVVFPF